MAPDVTVRKLALDTADHEQLDAAVPGSVPVLAPAPTLVVTAPSVTAHDDGVVEGALSLFEHAAAANMAASKTAEAIRRRG